MMNFSRDGIAEGDRFLVYSAITLGIIGIALLIAGISLKDYSTGKIGAALMFVGIGIRMCK